MQFQLVVFDMDGVLIDIESSWGWVHRHFGVDNSDNLEAYLDRRIDDHEFMRRDVLLWLSKKNKLHITKIEEILSTVPLMNGLHETVLTIKKAGLKTAIVSGGLEPLARRIVKETGIDYSIANGLKVDDEGYLTGEGILRVRLMDKGESLNSLLNDEGIKPEKCVTVGNSFIDVGLFEFSGLKIAFNPSDKHIKEKADVVVESKDLREILGHIF